MKLESTGRVLVANEGAFSVTDDGELVCGYDVPLYAVNVPLTAEERCELAARMVERWRKAYDEAWDSMTEDQ